MEYLEREKTQCCQDAIKQAEAEEEASVRCLDCNILWEMNGEAWEKGFDGLGLA